MSVAAIAASAQGREAEKAVEQLRASIDEWRREDAAFRASRKAGTLSKGESEDYAAFVAGLRLRVIEQCIEARKVGGDDAVKGYDCQQPTGPRETPPKFVAAARAQTEEEKRAALNARLNELEAEVDEKLLKKQREIRQTASNSAAAGGGASSANAGGQSGGGTGSSGDSGGPASGEKQARAGDATLPPTAAPPGAPGKRAQGTEAPKRHQGQDGVDDDVVARQLREAAEKETDPILKEKLWAEYRKYKSAQR